MCYCSPRSLSKGLMLRGAYRRMELGLQSYIGCVGVFRTVLNLYVATVVLSRVISGGSLLAGRARWGAGCCVFGCTSLRDVPEGRYKCNSIVILDAVILAGLWRQRGETGLRIVVWALHVGRERQGTAAASNTFRWEVITIDFVHLAVLRERAGACKFA